ncbi:MAG: N-acetylmuramoyl-L-alanine amidase [Oscillospiraceae bacterium]|nr:N-acetylmuramoyl-L-alanine amidase [Oscillospiraceae bacterium]
MSICISIGHGKTTSGAYDPGFVYGSMFEHEVAKKIGRFACDFFNENFDESCEIINLNSDFFLTERIKHINSGKFTVVVEIHLNLNGGEGVEVLKSRNSSSLLAEIICNEVSMSTGLANRGVKTKVTKSGVDFYSIIRETTSETVVVSCGFMESLHDMSLFMSDAGQKKIGEAIAVGIAKYRGLIQNK